MKEMSVPIKLHMSKLSMSLKKFMFKNNLFTKFEILFFTIIIIKKNEFTLCHNPIYFMVIIHSIITMRLSLATRKSPPRPLWKEWNTLIKIYKTIPNKIKYLFKIILAIFKIKKTRRSIIIKTLFSFQCLTKG